MANYQRRSYQDRVRHRKEFYKKHPRLREDSGEARFGNWYRRRLAPFVVLIFIGIGLFGLTYLVAGRKTEVEYLVIRPTSQVGLTEIHIPASNTLYTFQLHQALESAPAYSELQLEILDEHMAHVYSVYKDLWREVHPNGEGGTSVYQDNEVEFTIELEKAGTYFLRTTSFNDANGEIRGFLYKKHGGRLYFLFYTIIFGVLALVIILGSGYWGSVGEIIGELSNIRSIRHNHLFLASAGLVGIIYLSCIVISFTHYGYAKAGEEAVRPTRFYKTDNVIYIG